MKNLKLHLKKFLLGSCVGLFCGLIAWGYSASAHVAISPPQIILGLLFTAGSCGTIAAITDFVTLMERLPPL